MVVHFREKEIFMAKQGENIYQRKDGRWEGKYAKGKKDGKIRYGYVSGKNYEDVLQKKKKKLREIESGREQSVSLLLSSVSQRWLESRNGMLKETTMKKYQFILNNYIIPKFGDRQINELSEDEVYSWLLSLLKDDPEGRKGISTKSVSGIASVIRLLFRYANTDCHISVQDIGSLYIKQDKKQVTVLSHNEQEILEKYLMANMDLGNLGIMTCLYTGIRLGDYCVIISLNQLEAAK